MLKLGRKLYNKEVEILSYLIWRYMACIYGDLIYEFSNLR